MQLMWSAKLVLPSMLLVAVMEGEANSDDEAKNKDVSPMILIGKWELDTEATFEDVNFESVEEETSLKATEWNMEFSADRALFVQGAWLGWRGSNKGSWKILKTVGDKMKLQVTSSGEVETHNVQFLSSDTMEFYWRDDLYALPIDRLRFKRVKPKGTAKPMSKDRSPE